MQDQWLLRIRRKGFLVTSISVRDVVDVYQYELAGNQRIINQRSLTLACVTRFYTRCTQTVPGWIGPGAVETRQPCRSSASHGNTHRSFAGQDDQIIWRLTRFRSLFTQNRADRASSDLTVGRGINAITAIRSPEYCFEPTLVRPFDEGLPRPGGSGRTHRCS
jgi:hypothetical protein